MTPPMYAILYLGIAGVVAIGIHLVALQTWMRWAVAAVIAITVAVGGWGTWRARDATDRDVAAWSPQQRTPAELDAMRAQGYAEAMHPIELAGGVAGALVVALGIVELLRRRPRYVRTRV